MTETVAQKIDYLLRLERWAGEDRQREYDRRVVEYAQKNGIDPLQALTGGVHVIGAEAVAACQKGLNA